MLHPRLLHPRLLHPRLFALIVIPLIGVASVSAQSVLSARAGVLNLVEGSVQLDGMQVEQKFGAFPNIPEGSELRTQDGHAEVLLTPGVFLRLGENSSIRMLATSLVDTRVEFLTGSMMLEMTEPAGDTLVTVIANERKIHFPKEGLYRFDSDPLQVMVYRGEADIRLHEKSLAVSEDHAARLDQTLGAQQFSSRVGDDLESWSKDRRNSITADNFSEAQDPKPMDFSGAGSGALDPSGDAGISARPYYGYGSSSTYSVPGPVYLGSAFGYPYGLGIYSGFGAYPYSSFLYGPALFAFPAYYVPSTGSIGSGRRWSPNGLLTGGGAIRRPLPSYRIPPVGATPRVTIAPAPHVGVVHVGGGRIR